VEGKGVERKGERVSAKREDQHTHNPTRGRPKRKDSFFVFFFFVVVVVFSVPQ